MSSRALPIFVFDKDGVLVESEPIKLRLFEEMFASDYPEALPAIRAYNRSNIGMARKDKLQHVLGEILGIQTNLAAEVDRYLEHSYHFVRPALLQAPAVTGVVSFLKSCTHHKYVCSSALHQEVLDQLEALQITEVFTEVFAFPRQKSDVLSQLKSSHPGHPIVFWGDTLLDYQASRAAQVTFIGVGGPGHHPFDGLGVHTISDFGDPESLLAWIADNAEC